MKVVSLNLRRYYDWNFRKEKLFHFLKEYNPDIILLQEVTYDFSYSKKNQVQEIADNIGYKYCIFSSTGLKYTQRGEILKDPIQIGQGVISKRPLENIENFFLKKDCKDKEYRLVQNFSIFQGKEEFMFSNIHLSNSDEFAEIQFFYLLDLMIQKNEKRIICGDFNIKDLFKYKKKYEHDYISSKEFFDYISYKQKNETLDYILLPKKYNFKRFMVNHDYFSDHSLLYFEI